MAAIESREGETHSLTFYLRRLVQETPKLLPLPAGTATIIGHVVRADGTPASGIKVRAVMQANYENELTRRVKGVRMNAPYPPQLQRVLNASAITDQSGIYHLQGLTTAPYNIVLDTPWNIRGSTDTAAWTAVAATGVQAQENAIVTAPHLKLMPGTMLQVQIVDAATQQPLSKLNVACYDAGHPTSNNFPIILTTDSSGRVSFRVAPGKSYVAIAGPGRQVNSRILNLSDQAQSSRPANGHWLTFTLSSGGNLYAGWNWIQVAVDGGAAQPLRKDPWAEVTTTEGQSQRMVLELKHLTLKKPNPKVKYPPPFALGTNVFTIIPMRP